MLDYLGGEIVDLAGSGSKYKVTLQLRSGRGSEVIEQQFRVRGRSPGRRGQRLVVMLLKDEVVGWHNQATGAQGHLLNALPKLRWKARDLCIASASGLVLGWMGSAPLGLAVGLGWGFTTFLWRIQSIRGARAELVEALQLAAGVLMSKKSQTRPSP